MVEMTETYALALLSRVLKGRGFKVSINPFMEKPGWSFDLSAENVSELRLFEVRKNDIVSPIFIDKIRAIKRYPKKLLIYVVFLSSPRPFVVSLLKRMGVGVILFRNKRFYLLFGSNDFSNIPALKIPVVKKAAVKIQKPKRMHGIKVYVSSVTYEPDGKTKLKERRLICKVVNEYSRRLQIPINAVLLETVFKGHSNFKRAIYQNMKTCDVFVCALRSEYSDSVDYEIKTAFRMFSDKKLIFILKRSMDPVSLKPEQKRLIDYVKRQGIDYVIYSSFAEFEDVLNANLIKIIEHLYAKEKCASPFKF